MLRFLHRVKRLPQAKVLLLQANERRVFEQMFNRRVSGWKQGPTSEDGGEQIIEYSSTSQPGWRRVLVSTSGVRSHPETNHQDLVDRNFWKTKHSSFICWGVVAVQPCYRCHQVCSCLRREQHRSLSVYSRPDLRDLSSQVSCGGADRPSVRLLSSA